MEQMFISSIWAWPGDFHLGSAIAGAVVTRLITLIIALIVWVITKPRLTFETGPEIPFVLVAPRKDSPTGSATWILVRVKNCGWRDAQSCRVYLTDIVREGERVPILKEDAMRLWASAGGDGDDGYAPLTISRGFFRYFDIGFIPATDLNVASGEFGIRRPQPLPPGTYKFGIAASGNDFHPITRTVDFHFDDANTVKVSPIGASCRFGRLIDTAAKVWYRRGGDPFPPDSASRYFGLAAKASI
jgi:hypothetical protein